MKRAGRSRKAQGVAPARIAEPDSKTPYARANSLPGPLGSLTAETWSRIQARKWISSVLEALCRQVLGPDVDLAMVAEALEGKAQMLRREYEQRKRAERGSAT